MPSVHANRKRPAGDIQGWLAALINTVYGLPGAGAAMTTALAAATNIATLRSGVEALAVHAKNKHFTRLLSHALQEAYDMRTFGASDSASDTAIAALTTTNTAAAATDLLYLTCTQYDATLGANYWGHHATMIAVP